MATLRNRHVKVLGRNIRFQFRGKSSVEHAIDLQDKRFARIIKLCQDLPGYELFQYVDETGAAVAIEAGDVNKYLREIGGAEFSTKDFRTWAGTLMAADALRDCAACESKAQIKRNIVQAVDMVARALGNTKAVCRKCYIHPAVIEAYSSRALGRDSRSRSVRAVVARSELPPEEAALVALLEQQARASGAKAKPTRKQRRQRQNQTPFKNIHRSRANGNGAKLRAVVGSYQPNLNFSLLQKRHVSTARILILGRGGMERKHSRQKVTV